MYSYNLPLSSKKISDSIQQSSLITWQPIGKSRNSPSFKETDGSLLYWGQPGNGKNPESLNLVHILRQMSFNINFTIILPTTTRSLKFHLFSRDFEVNFIGIFIVTTRSTSYILSILLESMFPICWSRPQIMKPILFLDISSFCTNNSPILCANSPEHPLLNNSNLCSCRICKEHVCVFRYE